MRIKISELDSRASSINSYLSKLDSVFSQMIVAVSRFAQNEELKGFGYMSAKIYYRTVYTAIAYGFIRANAALREANTKATQNLHNGLDKIDTDEIQRALDRISAYEQEMNQVHEEVIFGFLTIEHKRVDRSAEIAAEQALISQIRAIVSLDSHASIYYASFNSIVADIKAAINKMNNVVFKMDTEYISFRTRGSEFNYTADDLKPFLNLMVGEDGNLYKTDLVKDDKYLKMLEDATFKTEFGYQDDALFNSIISINSEKYNNNPYNRETFKYKVSADFRDHFSEEIIDRYYRNTFWRYNVNNDQKEWQCTTYSFGRMLELYGLNYWDVKVNVRHVKGYDVKLNTLTGMPFEHEDRNGGNAGDWVDNMRYNKENGEPYYAFTTPESKDGKLTIEDVNVGDWIIWKVADKNGNILTDKYGHIATIEGIDYENQKIIYSEGNWGYNSSNQAGIYARIIPFDENGVLLNGTGDTNSADPGFYTRAYKEGNHYVLQGIIHTNEVLQDDANGNVTVLERYADNSIVKAPVS